MCAPALIPAIIGGVGALASTGLGVKGQLDESSFSAQQEENNAKLAMAQRADILQRGESQAARAEEEGREFASSAQAALATSGVIGSTQGLELKSRVSAAQDAAAIRGTAARQAFGFEQEAEQRRAQAKRTRHAGVLGAVGTGISGFGGLAKQVGGGIAGLF